jgi:hypothetical protein
LSAIHEFKKGTFFSFQSVKRKTKNKKQKNPQRAFQPEIFSEEDRGCRELH